MNIQEAEAEADKFHFKQVSNTDPNRMSAHVVVHGLTLVELIVKLNHMDTSWAQ